MIRIALLAALLLLSVATVAEPATEMTGWQPDVLWLEVARLRSMEHGKAFGQDWLAKQIAMDQARIRAAEIVLVGTITAVGTYEKARPWDIWTRRVVEIERSMKGTCGEDYVVFESRGGTVNGMTLAISGDDGSEGPVVGERYVLCLRRWDVDPEIILGGESASSYHIEHGVVARNGMLEDEFVGVLETLLAPREPRRLFAASDAVVRGVVKNVQFDKKVPPPAGSIHQDTNNFVLYVEDVAKGEMAVGQDLRIELPYAAGSAPDLPLFVPGQRVVLFLAQASGGRWELAGGKDSRLRVRPDGSFGCFKSLIELAVSGSEG